MMSRNTRRVPQQPRLKSIKSTFWLIFRRSVPAICSGFKVFLSSNLSAVSITLVIDLSEVNL